MEDCFEHGDEPSFLLPFRLNSVLFYYYLTAPLKNFRRWSCLFPPNLRYRVSGSSSPSASSVWGPYQYRRYCRCGSRDHLTKQAPALHQTEGIFGIRCKEALFTIKGGKLHYKLYDLFVQKFFQDISSFIKMPPLKHHAVNSNTRCAVQPNGFCTPAAARHSITSTISPSSPSVT